MPATKVESWSSQSTYFFRLRIITKAMHYLISKTQVLWPQALLTVLIVGLGSLATYQIAKHSWVDAIFLASVCGMLATMLKKCRTADADLLRFANLPLISFEKSHLIYRLNGRTDKTATINYSDISGVEFIITRSECSIRIQKWGAPLERIDINYLKAKHQDVFSALEQRLPTLIRPQPKALQLIAPRYLPKEKHHNS